jgi:tRNA(Ile2) C34 agmatinyltransferase TiaS
MNYPDDCGASNPNVPWADNGWETPTRCPDCDSKLESEHVFGGEEFRCKECGYFKYEG